MGLCPQADGIVVGAESLIADLNVVVAAAHAQTGEVSQGDVAAAGAAVQRAGTDGGVVVAGLVALKRGVAHRRVVASGRVGRQGEGAEGRGINAAGERNSAPAPVPVSLLPVKARFPAFTPAKKLFIPKVCNIGDPTE